MEGRTVDAIREQLGAIDDPLGLLAGFFAHAPVGLQIYRADGRCLLVNRAFVDLFGSTPPPDYDVRSDEIAAENGVLGFIERAFAGETVRLPPIWYDPRELRQVEVDGRRVAIEATFFPLFDVEGEVAHVAVTFQDRTAELLATQATESERTRLHTILDALPDAVTLAAPDGTLTYLNAAARGLLSLTAGVRVAEAVATTRPRDDDGRELRWTEIPLMRAARKGETVVAHEARISAGDRERIVAVSAAPRRDDQGEIVEGIAIFRDVTARRAAEDEVRRLSAVKDEFLSIASHELRTPLTALKLTLQTARRRLVAADPVATLGAILEKADRHATRMARLVSDLLDGARIEGGRLPLDRHRQDVVPVVLGVLDDSAAYAGDRAVERIVPEGPLHASIDAERIAQIVANLLTNAGRYTDPKTPITVRIEERRRGERWCAAIAVEDRGPGIPDHVRTRIFDRFVRGAREEGRNDGGLGLGLYIAKAIAEGHGGALEVESAVGVGSTFTVWLPLEEP